MINHAKYFVIFLVAFCGGLSQFSYGQIDEKYSAKDYFEYEDYNRALVRYLKMYETDSTDIEINLQIGRCYLNVNDDKTKSIPFLEYVYKKGEYNSDLFYYLGQAYMYQYKFDDAIKYFNLYQAKEPTTNQQFITQQIENCESAKVLMQKPVNVTFENLGEKVNGKYPDYSPFITRNQERIYFTSSRVTNARKIKSSEGYYTSDIYYSIERMGNWGKAKSVGTAVNTAEDEQCVYVTPDGNNMIVYLDNLDIHGDLFFTQLKERVRYFPKPQPFYEPVNTKHLELEGCITEDGQTLIISSNRPEGMGETDLYKLKRLPNGEWGTPVSLGPNINTIHKDGFPVFDEKNGMLYFASKGHINMGGFDIFKSKYDKESETFGKAINMGYPINTPENNIGFSITENGRDGYMAAVRKEGYGDLDIYKIVFNDVEDLISVIKGIITTGDTLKNEIDALVTLTNEDTNEEIDVKNANPKNGHFIFAVNPGKYSVEIKSEGHEDIKETIIVYDKSNFIFEIEKFFVLQKKPEPILQNDSITPNEIKSSNGK